MPTRGLHGRRTVCYSNSGLAETSHSLSHGAVPSSSTRSRALRDGNNRDTTPTETVSFPHSVRRRSPRLAPSTLPCDGFRALPQSAHSHCGAAYPVAPACCPQRTRNRTGVAPPKAKALGEHVQLPANLADRRRPARQQPQRLLLELPTKQPPFPTLSIRYGPPPAWTLSPSW